MLTKRSSSLSKGKLLLTLPLVAICLLCFTKNSFSGQRKWHGNTVTYNGNTIETSLPPQDTAYIMNASTGKNEMKVFTLQEHMPSKLNGQKIYAANEIASDNALGKPAGLKSTWTSDILKEYLLSNLKNELKDLSDGDYNIDISHIVVNEKGEIVYFDYDGIIPSSNSIPPVAPKNKVSKETQNVIGRKVEELINDAPAHRPAYVNGYPVAYLVNSVTFRNPFTIKDHKVVSE